jgi:trigger factor
LKSEVQKKEGNTVTLSVELPPEQVAAAIDKAYLVIRKDIALPGFRKGKVPRQIIEKRYGVEVFFEEAANIMLQDAYPKAVVEHNLEPVDKPKIDVEEIGVDKPFRFNASITVLPDVRLGAYTKLGIARESVAVGPEDVDAELVKLQDRKGRLVAVAEGTAASPQDQVIIDFTGRINGEEFAGGSGVNHPLVLGSDAFVPGFEEQLVGVMAGEEVKVVVTMPEDYHSEELAGKEVEFTVQVKEIKRKELPGLDDEFAKDISEYQTLAELKNFIHQSKEKHLNQQADQKQRQEIVQAVSEKAEVDIPVIMIENELEAMVRQTEARFSQQGLKFDDFLQYSGKDLEQYKQEIRPNAESNVKTELVLDALAQAENILVSQEELAQEVEKMAEEYGRTKEELMKILEGSGQLQGIEQVLLHRKVIDYLVVANS